MNHIRLLAVAAAFAAASLNSFATSSFGPVNFKLESVQTNIVDQETTNTTTTSTSTNIVTTQLYTKAVTNINNAELLTMLANSFNMTWPAGATLKTDSSGDFAVFSGSTLVQDVTSVLSLSNANNGVYNGAVVLKETLNSHGLSESESVKYTETVSATLIYDDSALSTANGTTTQITVNGIESVHGVIAATSLSNAGTKVISFIGTGTGTNSVLGVPSNTYIVGGTFNGNAPDSL